MVPWITHFGKPSKARTFGSQGPYQRPSVRKDAGGGGGVYPYSRNGLTEFAG